MSQSQRGKEWRRLRGLQLLERVCYTFQSASVFFIFEHSFSFFLGSAGIYHKRATTSNSASKSKEVELELEETNPKAGNDITTSFDLNYSKFPSFSRVGHSTYLIFYSSDSESGLRA